MEFHWPLSCADTFNWAIMSKPDILAALEKAVEAFDRMGIEYIIGGSVASSVYGMARATLDIDLEAKVLVRHVDPMVEALKNEYYIAAESIKEAIRNCSSFNLVHLDTMIKIDIFVKGNRPYDLEEFSRKKRVSLADDTGTLFNLLSAEDIILNKLIWYNKGGMVSQRQWQDILGVLKVQCGNLDRAYLQRWAMTLNCAPQLRQAIKDAGLDLRID
jgi:hypothetical protein